MTWALFVLGAVLSWGAYGSALHNGQLLLGNGFRALLCVGIAYVVIAIVIPTITLSSQGQLNGFTGGGTSWALVAGALGAAGAACITFSFITGGRPIYVMPLVFGGAPLVNVLVTMVLHPPKQSLNPMLYLGFLITAGGAAMVLYFRPQG
jgi:hypothetical protein